MHPLPPLRRASRAHLSVHQDLYRIQDWDVWAPYMIGTLGEVCRGPRVCLRLYVPWQTVEGQATLQTSSSAFGCRPALRRMLLRQHVLQYNCHMHPAHNHECNSMPACKYTAQHAQHARPCSMSCSATAMCMLPSCMCSHAWLHVHPRGCVRLPSLAVAYLPKRWYHVWHQPSC